MSYCALPSPARDLPRHLEHEPVMSNGRVPRAAPDPGGQTFSAAEILDSPSAESGRRLPAWLSGLGLAGFLVVLVASLPTLVLDQASRRSGQVALRTPASAHPAVHSIDAGNRLHSPICSTGWSYTRALIGCDRRRRVPGTPRTTCIAEDRALRGSGACRVKHPRVMRPSRRAPDHHRWTCLRRVTRTVETCWSSRRERPELSAPQ
jgi:hypothetical protein